MLQSVEANLLADLIWLPVGGLLLWLLRRVWRQIRADLADHGERIDAVHNRLDALTPTTSEQELQHDH